MGTESSWKVAVEEQRPGRWHWRAEEQLDHPRARGAQLSARGTYDLTSLEAARDEAERTIRDYVAERERRERSAIETLVVVDPTDPHETAKKIASGLDEALRRPPPETSAGTTVPMENAAPRPEGWLVHYRTSASADQAVYIEGPVAVSYDARCIKFRRNGEDRLILPWERLVAARRVPKSDAPKDRV